MGFVTNISDFGSLAIVGLEKNTGKTECLNYILGQLGGQAERFALTSVGIDGESRDQVCQTAKPEIEIPEGMIFVTSEKHYREKRLAAEVLDVSLERTALGRLITARAKMSGKLLLSGPSDTAGLKALIDLLKSRGVGTTIVDGALSRLSLASPAVTEAMILATGAAVAGNIPELVRKTKYVYELIGIEEIEKALRTRLAPLTQGVWAVRDGGEPIDLDLPSVLRLLETEEGRDRTETIRRKLALLRDIRSTIERTGGNCVFDDIELFELKFFALLAEELRPLASQGHLAELPELNGVVDLLDPEGNRLPHFFVYDAYSEELATLRKQIKARKQAGADESQVQELYFRSVEIEDRIRERLSVELRKYHEALQQALDRMGWLDVVIAKAMQARDWGLTRPAITQDTTSFRGLFNPELRISLEAAGKRFQPVNIRLTTGPTVITGANMSGKTVLLHSVELAQYMLQFGFYIAAERAEIALEDEVHCSIGDGQDQLSGLSSFAAEMMRMDELAKSVRAGRRVLALIDEPARTTNPVEGRAIVNGVLEFLADYEVPSLVTTHYNGIAAPCRKLKVKGFSETNAEERITLKNINDFIDYSLEEVTTDEVPHEAIRIARILGIDPEILRRIERNEELKNNQ